MKHKRILIVGALLALLVALSGGAARADKKIDVTYVTAPNASGLVCVTGTPVISNKNVKIKKLDQKIKWVLIKTNGDDAGGTWQIDKVAGGNNPSVDLCQGEIKFDAQGKAECRVAAELKYSYNLTWNKTGCAPVQADPAIMFEGGGGGDISGMVFGIAVLMAVLAFGLGLGLARIRKS